MSLANLIDPRDISDPRTWDRKFIHPDHRRTGVYKLVNLVNGKVYVGSAAESFHSRWNTSGNHFPNLRAGTHVNARLQNAYNKYGQENIQPEIIEFCPPDQCIEREQYWLDYYQSYLPENGYNLCRTAGSTLGLKLTEETCRKIGEQSKKRWEKEEFREQQSAKQKELWADEEYHKRMVAKRKEVWDDPELRAQRAEITTKLWEDEEYREKVMSGLTESQKRPEVRRRRSEGQRKAFANPEVKKKFRERNIRRYKDPAERIKTGEKTRERFKDPKERKKQSERGKKRHADNPPWFAPFIPEIKRLWATGEYTRTRLSQLFNVSWPTINKIVSGKHFLG